MSETSGAQSHLEAHTVAAYVDGRLSSSDAAGAEAHLAECATCRAEVVQVNAIVRRRRPRRRYVGALAAAAVLILLMVPRVVRSPVLSSGDAVRELGAVAQPPVYLGVSVRAASEQGTRMFATGMRAYTDARYTDAVTDLRGARSSGVQGPAATFFLGASLLMLGDATSAVEELARVIAMGQTQYRAEAHYYRAKALLRLNRRSDALTELEQAIGAGNESVETVARSLRDSVRLLAR